MDFDREKAMLNGRLVAAAWTGDVKDIQFCLPAGADATYQNSKALTYACDSGNEECVRLLLDVSDPLDGRSLPIRLAYTQQHMEIAALLVPHSNLEDCIQAMLDTGEGWRVDAFKAFFESETMKLKYDIGQNTAKNHPGL